MTTQVRRARMVAALAVIFSINSLASTAPVSAECGAMDPWPSFAAVAPDAYAVVVGKVERVVSRKRHHVGSFVLRVQETVRGDVGERITLEDVYTTGGCVTSWLDVEPGDRIAVALGGHSNVNGPAAAVAYLSAVPDDTDLARAGMERLTMREVRGAARPRPEDDSPEGLVARSVTDSVRSIVLLLGLVHGWRLEHAEDAYPSLPFP